jgi:uncharacterized repeat protein (TIGR02543 family)
MLKKFTWIAAALLAALAMAFFGCTDMGVGLGDGDRGAVVSEPPVVVDGASIVLTKVGNGNGSAGASVDGNKYKLDAKGATGTGFAIPFPASVKGKVYKEIVVEMEVVAIASPNFISFNAKEDNTLAADVLIVGHTQQYHNEFKLGTITDKALTAPCSADCLKFTPDTCVVGAKNTAAYPYEKFPKDMIVFQYNPYAGDISPEVGSANVVSDFEIAVTKVTFVPYEGIAPPPPAPPPSYTPEANVVFAANGTGREDDTVTDNAPAVSGERGMTISSTGVVTMTSGSVLYYKFPTTAKVGSTTTTRTVDIEKDFDSVVLTFAISNVVLGTKPAGGDSDGHFKVEVFTYENDAEYGIAPGVQYQRYGDFGSAPTGTGTIPAWGAYGTGGVAIRYNFGDRNGDGAVSMDVRLTKVEFKAAQRYKVTFYNGINAGVTYDIISGNTLNKSLIPSSVYTPTRAGWKLDGWYKEEGFTNAFNTSANGDTITDDTGLYAKWGVELPLTKPALDPVSVSSTAATETLFDATGSYAGALVYEYTPPGGTASLGKYWIVGDTRSSDPNGWSDWSDGKAVAPFNDDGDPDADPAIPDGPGVTVRNAIFALQNGYGSGTPYTRIGFAIDSTTVWTGTATTNPRFDLKWYDKVEITYDLVHIGGSLDALVRGGPTGTNSDSSIGGRALEAGTGKTLTLNMSDISGGVSFNKQGPGAFLLRITKVTLLQE